MADPMARKRSSEVMRKVCERGKCSLYPFTSEIIQKVMHEDIIASSGCLITCKSIISAIATLSCQSIQQTNNDQTSIDQLQSVLNNLLNSLQQKIMAIKYNNVDIKCEETITHPLTYTHSIQYVELIIEFLSNCHVLTETEGIN